MIAVESEAVSYIELFGNCSVCGRCFIYKLEEIDANTHTHTHTQINLSGWLSRFLV